MLAQSPGRVKAGRKSCYSEQMMYILDMRRSKFSGVYSFSATWTQNRGKTYYFVWELPDGAFAVQELNAAFQPVSEVERISAKSFSRNFAAEPNILAMPIISPDLSHFEQAATAHSTEISSFEAATSAPAQTLASGKPAEAPTKQRPRNDRLPETVAVAPAPSAPPATQKAYDLEAARKAKAVESQLRETFRQTLLRLKRPRERQAALLALEQMANATEGITSSHKHMFRDFGVRLRQNSQPDLALRFTRKAVELAPEDDHAHFNLARILCSLGMYDEAAAHISTALSMAGDEPLYFKLLTHIRELKQKNGAAQTKRPR